MTKTLLASIFSAISWMAMGQSKEQKLQHLMQAYHELNKLNGSVLITQDGKIILNQGYGLRNINENLKNDPTTVFQVGSVTKQFTAAVILKLQEMNKLNVEEKLSKYFPHFPKGDSITIEQLLTHTSGIFNFTDDPIFMQTKASQPVSETEMLSLMEKKPLKFSPGSNWSYSNANYLLLGYIIEQVCHKPYAEVVKELVLKPLKMTETGFDFARLHNSHQAKGYKAITDNAGDESADFDYTVSFAAGGMYSTTGDLYKWVQGFESSKILRRQSFAKAVTPVRNKYGYGLYVDSIYGKRFIAHGGLTMGFTSYVGSIAEDGVAIIILNNTVNYSINQIAKDVLAILYNQPYKVPEAQKEMLIDSNVLKNYTGIYQLTPQITVVFTVEDGRLMAQVGNQPKVALRAQKEDLFFVKGADINVQFVRDATGALTEVKLLEGNMVTIGTKIK